ncbi:MAG: hypothetical protein ACI9W2_002481 [Gammaproteobacteria bacterium]|jgi:uncharacterized protein (TIGR02466 family)
MPPTDVDYHFEKLFPSTLLMADYPDATVLNETLTTSVYAVQQQDQEGRSLSEHKYGVGYTSFFSKIRLTDYPGFLELAEFITRFGHWMAEHLELDLSNHALGMINYWANINPTYSFHHIHVHPEAIFSGVYYVNAPTDDSGKTMFKDPRPAAVMTTLPLLRRTPDNSDTTTISPTPGRLLMFPAWLPHGVDQNLGTQDRISISYNIGLRQINEANGAAA